MPFTKEEMDRIEAQFAKRGVTRESVDEKVRWLGGRSRQPLHKVVGKAMLLLGFVSGAVVSAAVTAAVFLLIG